MSDQMTQVAPYPEVLDRLVEDLRYKEGWRFSLEHVDRGQGSEGLTLEVLVVGTDSYHPDVRRGVRHFFPVPPAAYDEGSWTRWLFDRVMDVETHEGMEFFRLSRDVDPEVNYRPYAPNHGPGNDPYQVRQLTTDEARRTSFMGEVKPALR